MDLAMPEMDGLSATRQIRETDIVRSTPIIALSAFVADDRRDGSICRVQRLFE